MGKQIRFYQTDSDISHFRDYLEKQKLILFHYNKNTEIFDDISIWGSERIFFIGTLQMKDKGTLIEYVLPTRSFNRLVPENKIGIEGGRFYLSNELYDDKEATEMYNLLKQYVKKNYVFSKDASCYFSMDFIEMYKTLKYHLINC